MLLYQEIGHKTAALLLYALQTASSNLNRTNFDPRPEQVLTDAAQLAKAVIGGDAWSKQTLNATLKKERKTAAQSAAPANALPSKESAEKVNGGAVPQNPPDAPIDLKASAEHDPEWSEAESVEALGTPLIAHLATRRLRLHPNGHPRPGVKSRVANIRA